MDRDNSLGILRLAVANIEEPNTVRLLDIIGLQACDLVTPQARIGRNQTCPRQRGCRCVLVRRDLKLGGGEQRGDLAIAEWLIMILGNAFEALSVEGIGVRLLTPNGALVDCIE